MSRSSGYMRVGALTARWVLGRRRKFFSDDVAESIKKRARSTDINHLVNQVGEFLAAWEHPEQTGHSYGAMGLLRRHPNLHYRVRSYWQGF